MGALEELTVECQFYAAIHELAVVAWRQGLTLEALLALAEVVDPLPRPDRIGEWARRCAGDGR